VIGVERSIVDTETGLRGYVLTGAPARLDPLRAADRALPHETTALTRAAASEHDHAAETSRLAADARR